LFRKKEKKEVLLQMLRPIHQKLRIRHALLFHYMLSMVGFVRRWPRKSHLTSSTVHFFSTILSAPGAHGECATFDVWVEAFGAELLFFLFF
jgi:hypothetical protein